MNRLETMLGFASKAGKLLLGTSNVERGIKKGKVYMVVCATDLAPRTIRNFQYLCDSKRIVFICYGLRSELGNLVGAPERGVIGIASQQFARALRQLFEDRGDES
jgi:ribosomal protein L7Ae-like RNA K-turn-binding protein